MTNDHHSKGEIARAAKLTPEERSAIARHAALSRHKKDLPKAEAEGILEIGDLRISCAVLDDENNTRVLTQNGFLKAIGRHPFASGGTGASIDGTPTFLRPKNLKPFITSELERSTTPTQFLPKKPDFRCRWGWLWLQGAVAARCLLGLSGCNDGGKTST